MSAGGTRSPSSLLLVFLGCLAPIASGCSDSTQVVRPPSQGNPVPPVVTPVTPGTPPVPDSLSVTYNLIMRMTDFIDGTYVR